MSNLTIISSRDGMWVRISPFSNVRMSFIALQLILTSFYQHSGGMIAPILGGALLMADRSLPVYTSIVVFLIAAVCTLCISEDEGHENGGGIGRGGGGVVVH